MERPYKVFRLLDSGVPHTPPEVLQFQPLPLGEPPEDKDGFHFVCGTINEDGEDCETWAKKWEFLGAHILYEKHGKLCQCSYCEEFDKKRGIIFPECRCRNAWRIFYWRKPKWPCELSCIRVTLPRFISWKCRFCRNAEKKGMVTTPTAKLRRF